MRTAGGQEERTRAGRFTGLGRCIVGGAGTGALSHLGGWWGRAPPQQPDRPASCGLTLRWQRP